MKELIEYLERKKIKYQEIDENHIRINDEVYFLVIPNEEGLLFSSEFMLMTNYQNCDKYVYSFGGKWYWESKSDSESPKLNELIYIGKSQDDIETKSFLGVHGGYEILNGSRLYGDWCKKAKFLGCETLGILEKNTLAGVLKFQLECKKNGIKPIIGATYTVFREEQDYRYDIKLFVKNEVGWENILLINKEVNVLNFKYITESRLSELIDGLVIIVDPKSLDFSELGNILKKFKVDYYQLDTIEFENNDTDKRYLENLRKFYSSSLEPISITDAYYLEQEHYDIKSKLNSISGVRESVSKNQFFKSKGEYFDELNLLFNLSDEVNLFNTFEQAIKNEKIVCDDCVFSIRLGERFLPKYEMNEYQKIKFKDNEDLFWYLIEDGLKRKIKENHKIYLERIDKEFSVIEKGDVIDYFLILWDIIIFARENNILVGVGRGSAGGSIISYLLDIIQLDPIEFDLLFERFLNEGRIVKSLPDIDTDFPGEKRGIIKKYIEDKYGVNQVCSVGTYTALQVKASIKDLSKINNLDFSYVNHVTTLLPNNLKNFNDLFYSSIKSGAIKGFIKNNTELVNDINLILHQPKAKSIHACAMLILPKEKDIFRWLPVSDIDGQIVSEWEGPELEQAGFLKEDILGIQQLDKFESILELIRINHKKEIDIYSIKFDDDKVFKYFQKGWNEDVFHFGSPGLTGYCKELLPENIEDLIAGISLYRPGAMENNFHNEYILRKEGKRDVEYFVGTENILDKTYGVFVYQEQIMKLCQVLGGLSLVEADDVRKSMVKKKYEELTKYKDRFIKYYVENFNVPLEYSEKVWEAIDKASTYLFNRSHATAYAITGYISQWFKVHYPIEFWSIAFKYADERDFPKFICELNNTGNIKVTPVDINNSGIYVSLDYSNNKIFWPLSSIKQCGEKASSQIIDLRDKFGKYFSFEEFLERNKFKGSKVNKQIIENLIISGAFDNIEFVENVSERLRILKKFYSLNSIKESESKFLSQVNIKNDWWWSLQQKKYSGISFFNYKDLIKINLDSYSEIIKPEDFQLSVFSKNNTEVSVGGVIFDFNIRNSKKGKWCKLTIESNYNFIDVIIWAEQFKLIKEEDLSLGEIILISGKIYEDSYRNYKYNILQTFDGSEIKFLK